MFLDNDWYNPPTISASTADSFYSTFSTRTSTTPGSQHDENYCAEATSSTSNAAPMMILMNICVSILLAMIAMAVFWFASRNSRDTARRPLLARSDSTGSDWVKTFYSQSLVDNSLDGSRNSSDTGSDVVYESSAELGFFLPVFWFWKTEEIERRCGKSATQYIRFMEHVMLFTSIVVVFSAVVILPLNLRGKMIFAAMDFGRTTMINIPPRDNILWVHITFSLLLFPVAVLCIHAYGRKFRGYSKPVISSKTLMFTNLNAKHASEEKIQQHFENLYQDINVEKVNLTYHVAKLTELDDELQLCKACLKYYERNIKPGAERPLYSADNMCTRCCCCCCDVGVDAVEYYTTRASELENRIEEVIDSPRKINRTFFTTFETEDMATKMVKRYHHGYKSIFSPTTPTSKELGAKIWTAKHAPYPDLIKWENLESEGLTWWLRAIVLNVGLFIFLFFITSPVIILNALGLAEWAKNIIILNQIIPALILIELGLMISYIIRWVVKETKYHEKIKQQLQQLRASFVYTLIAQLILPTFGLTSAKALYDYIAQSSSSGLNWACVFLPDNGMVFVTFFIFQSFFGTAMVFSRVIELQVLALKRCNTRSDAEKWLISQRKRPFNFISSYTRNLVLVTIIITYAFVVPYIGPLGLFTLLLNHIAERYSIFFVYKKHEIPNPIHKTGVTLFLFCVLFELYMMLFFTAIRSSNLGFFALITGIVIYTLIFAYIASSAKFALVNQIPFIGSRLPDHDSDEDSYDPVAEPQNYEADILRRYEMLRPLTLRSNRKSPSWHE